jgi:hypothetical protein
VAKCKPYKIQVCFFKKKQARGIFAAVEDLFNLKIFGDIIWHKRHNEWL